LAGSKLRPIALSSVAAIDFRHYIANWCPGWESNPHEEKSPEDFKCYACVCKLLHTQLVILMACATV